MMIILLVAAFALVMAAIVSQAVFGRRLRAIIHATARIREGDLSARVGIQDESSDLGQIVQALDLMAETIETRNREQDERTEQLRSAVAEKEMLIKEVHHRVKNNLQLILSMIRLQDDAKGDIADFKSAMESRVGSMALVHEMLYKKDTQEEVELSGYVRKIVELILGGNEGIQGVRVDFEMEELRVPHDRAVPFGLLVNELVMNALKHGVRKDTGGRLTVRLRREQAMAEVAVSDDGPGLPENFDPTECQGLGLKLADALATQLKGKLRWENAPGARFSVKFPLQD
jgi:two-component sensor histidine kinase